MSVDSLPGAGCALLQRTCFPPLTLAPMHGYAATVTEALLSHSTTNVEEPEAESERGPEPVLVRLVEPVLSRLPPLMTQVMRAPESESEDDELPPTPQPHALAPSPLQKQQPEEMQQPHQQLQQQPQPQQQLDKEERQAPEAVEDGVLRITVLPAQGRGYGLGVHAHSTAPGVVSVSKCDPAGQAYAAGVRNGDVLLEINGHDCRSVTRGVCPHRLPAPAGTNACIASQV